VERDDVLSEAVIMRRATLLRETKIDESTETVVTALVRRLNRLFRAEAVLTGDDIPAPSLGDIAVAADALEAGVSEAALLEIQSTSPGDHRDVATEMLVTLVQLGHVPEDALARVKAGLDRGPEGLANLRSEAERRMSVRRKHMPDPPGGRSRAVLVDRSAAAL
jgi:hypothetical protein